MQTAETKQNETGMSSIQKLITFHELLMGWVVDVKKQTKKPKQKQKHTHF